MADEEDKKKKPHINTRVSNYLGDAIWNGTSPYQRDDVQSVPYNPTNGRSFNGLNAVNLMARGHKDGRWYTFDEASAQGYLVRGGSRGVPVQNWLPLQPGQTKREVNVVYVLNAEQLRNVPPQPRTPPQRDPLQRLNEILENSTATVAYDAKDKAFYAPQANVIHLPKVENAESVEKYCADALQCYFRSTGHPDCLDRQETFLAVSQDGRSRESFICETATMLMCAEMGIPHDPTKNAEHHKQWAGWMNRHPYDFSVAVSQANDAVYHTLQQEQKRDMELNPLESGIPARMAEESPMRAVATYFNREESVRLQQTDPEKVFTFSHQDTEIVTIPEKEKAFSREAQEDGTIRTKLYTEGYGEHGSTFSVVLEYTAEKLENGMLQPITPYLVESVYEKANTRSIPAEWTGELVVQSQRIDENGQAIVAENEAETEFYRVLAVLANGDKAMIADYDHKQDAEKFVSMTRSEYEKQARQFGIEPEEQSQEQVGEQGRAADEQLRDFPNPEHPKGYELTDEQKQELVDKAKEHVEKRDAAINQDTQAAVKRLKGMMSRFEQPTVPTPYLMDKNVPLQPGILQNKGSTCVPLHDINGELRSMAYVNKDGTPRLAKGTDATHAFFTVGGADALKDAPAIILTKDLAPAISINQAADVPVVAVFHEENLASIINDIKERNSGADIYYAGSNQMDKYTVVKAMETTEAKLIMPRFASGEQDARKFNDFNDLAEQSKLGKDGLAKQLDTALRDRAKGREETREAKQEKTRGAKEMSRA